MKLDTALYVRLLREAADNPRLRQATDLRTSPADQSQRMLNALLPGTVVPIHRHPHSAETAVVLSGCRACGAYRAGRRRSRSCPA